MEYQILIVDDDKDLSWIIAECYRIMGIKYCVPQTVHMDTTPEKRMKFAEVIIRKCDEVSALTNDLFLHALSDMDKLEMNMHEVKLCAFMRKAVAELISDMDSVRLYLPDSEWVILADEKRLMQLTENILNNAAKYGEMPVDITIRQKDNDTVQINFKDYGNGMKDEDILFALIVVIMFCHRMFLQEKTDIGILKAMGLTSIQLRLSFGLRFLLLAVSGAVPGVICSVLLSGKLLTAILKPMGITHLIISLRPATVLFPIGLICVSFFLFAFLVSRGIKKLSATVLIAE